MEAQAKGTLAQLAARADGFRSIIEAAGGAEAAARLMVTEQLPKLVEEQVKAISNLKIDSVTVWEGGRGKEGKGSTADFLSSLVGVLPPLQELTKNVGLELPEYLGRAARKDELPEASVPVPGPRKTPDRTLRRWLSEHRHLLVAFDSDENTSVDERELDNALTLTRQWGAKARSTPNAKWFLASEGASVGPKFWPELIEEARSKPDLLISLEGTEFWIPFRAVEMAAME